MPEMPEVETVRRSLEPLIKNKVIKEITIWYSKIVNGNPEEFIRTLQGKKILTIQRRAKFLLFRLSDNLTIVSHLRMEGKYRLVKVDEPKDKHDHVQFAFTDGTALRYNDVRKFGRMQLVTTGTEKQTTGIGRLGYDPGSPEFTKEFFLKAVKNKKKYIKATLLEQTIVSGLGNIYVDEVLWRTKIHPKSQTNRIPLKKLIELYDQINSLIKEAIKYHGTTVHSYLDANGQTGSFQKCLKVYGRSGEKCFNCGNILSRTTVSGRGSTYCPVCQVLYS